MASGCLGCVGLLQADASCLCAQPKYGRFRGLDFREGCKGRVSTSDKGVGDLHGLRGSSSRLPLQPPGLLTGPCLTPSF